MKIFLKLSAVMCSCVMSAMVIFSTSVFAIDTEESYVETTGDCILESEVDPNIPCYDNIKVPQLRAASSVDNSASVYFPPIGYQGRIGSCTAWATTYYQYTYEVNKFKGTATNESNIYSPAWTYNYLNGGKNVGTSIDEAYGILQQQGAMKLCDFPHNNSSYSYNWSTDVPKMVDALEYRVSPFNITCPSSSSSDISNLKSYLSNGKVGVVHVNTNGWTETTTTTGQKIIIRGSNNDEDEGGHALTIVGYDDNVKTVYKDVTLTGAFKVANSWGSNWSNSGYIWIAYDALNAVGSGNLDSFFSTERKKIFCDNNNNNIVYFVNIKHYNRYYVGKVTYISNDPYFNSVYGDINTTANIWKFSPYYLFDQPKLNNPEYRVIVFDYFSNNSQNVANYINSNFTCKLYNPRSNTTYRIYMELMDNLCKTIEPHDTVFGSLPTGGGGYSRTFKIGLKKGRISTYDNGNITSSDVSLLQSYIVEKANLSSLQMYLADMDNDGFVNVFDLVILKREYSSQNGKIANPDEILSIYMPELESTIEEYILSEYGEDGVTFAEELLTH